MSNTPCYQSDKTVNKLTSWSMEHKALYKSHVTLHDIMVQTGKT